MNTYRFYLDRKVSVWNRNHFYIKANSKKEAIDLIKEQYRQEGDYIYIEGESETLYDTEEVITGKENQAPTVEIFDEETEELILSNYEPH